MQIRTALATTLFALVASVLLVAPSVDAADAKKTPPDVSSKELKSAQIRFERAYDTADIDFKLDAVKAYGKVQHKTIAKHLIKLLKEDDAHIRAALATALGNQLSTVPSTGKKLLKLAKEKDEEPRVVKAAIDSMAKLRYEKGETDIRLLIHHADDGVVASVFGVYGTWKSDIAIREMLDFFTKYPDEKTFATGSVTVDTGAAGNTDQKAAQAKWKAKYGGQRGWRPRPECTRALIAALKEITGFGFRRPEDLKAYIDDPETYVDPETITERKSNEEQMEIYASWCRAVTAAEDYSIKEIKGDEAHDADKRAKVYKGRLHELRADIMKKHELKLSELDVVVEEGEKRSWPES